MSKLLQLPFVTVNAIVLSYQKSFPVSFTFAIEDGVYLTGFFSNYPTQKIMTGIFTFLSNHKLTPVIGKVFDFDDMKDAIAAQDSGRINGKIVVKI